MSGYKKVKGYADGGEITNEVEDVPQGRFSSDVYERARKFVEGGGKTAPASTQKARRAAPKAPDRGTDTGDESSRLAARNPAPKARPMTNADDPSIPGPEPVQSGAPRSRASRVMSEAKDNVSRGMDALGPLGVAAGVGLKALRSAGRASTRAAGREVMESGNRRAGEMRERMSALREGRERAQEAASARGSAREAAEARRRAPRDMDEERMSGEGGAFAKGGMVGGCSHRDYGKK